MADYLKALAFRKENSPAQIARRYGISTAYLYRLVSKHEKENGLEPTTTSRPARPLSETVGAHAELMVPGGGVANRDRVIELARKGLNPTQIAREIGIARQNVYLHLPEELRPRAVKRNEAVMQPLSETIGAHASPVVPESEPGQQEAAENAANQS